MPRLARDWQIFEAEYAKVVQKLQKMISRYGTEIVEVMVRDSVHAGSLKIFALEISRGCKIVATKPRTHPLNGNYSGLRDKVVSVINDSFAPNGKQFTFEDVCLILEHKGVGLEKHNYVSAILKREIDGIVLVGTKNRGQGKGSGRSQNVYAVIAGKTSVKARQ